MPLLIVILCLNCSCTNQTLKQGIIQPNFVFILVDDLGYSDLDYLGHKENLSTPNIDKLAESGKVFTQAYAAAPVCSPTRASVLTGRSPATLKITCHIPGVPMDQYFERQHKGKNLKEAFFKDHLPIEEVTIADKVSAKGYTTGFFGKWHLAGSGSAKSKSDGIIDDNFHPEHQGFDINIGGCAYGQPASWFSPYRNATIQDKTGGEYLTDRLGNEATKFISQNQKNPFFLFLSTYTVHTPLKAPQHIVEKNNGNTYHAMIEKLDENVGKVVGQINKLGLRENTIFIFYSDNGGLWGNAPLRGNKGSLYEGGIRVPLIVNWSTKFAPGEIKTPVSSVDLFPTIMDIANISIKDKSKLEGLSLVPLLLDSNESLDRPLYWHFPHFRKKGQDMGAVIRDGDWKLIWDFETDSTQLYNLNSDLAEANNLHKSNSEQSDKLLARLKSWLKEVDAEMPTKL